MIRKLKNYSAFPGSAIPPNNSANIFSVSGDKIEIGTFKRVDQGTDSSNFVILVNRVCNTSTGAVSSPQNVSMSVNGGKYFVQDQRTKAVTVGSHDGGTNRTTFSITLDPGEGKLFLLKKVREGTIASNQTWRDVEVIVSTVTVNSGVTLTILPNTLVKVQNLSALTINGSLSAQGTANSRITLERLGTSGDWTGIRFQAGSSGSLNFATIRYPKKGVYIATVAPTIQNCIIENFTEQGIYILDANAKIYSNTINGWNGTSRVGTGIYVNNSGLGSSTLEITGNTVKGAIVGIDLTAPVLKLEQNTLGTSGAYTTASSNAYGIVFAGVGTVTNNKTYGDNTNSWGISLAANSGTKSTTYNLLDHHNIGLVDNGFQNGSISRNSFSNNGTGFNNSDGWMTANENNFWDSPSTTYNIANVSTSCPDHTNNYLESWSSSSDPKYYNPYCGNDPWYPPAGSPFTAGPTWKAVQDEEQ